MKRKPAAAEFHEPATNQHEQPLPGPHLQAEEEMRPRTDEESRTRAQQALRARAEKAQRQRAGAAAAPVPEDLAAVAHELRVHQIELEMQNEELRRAQLELDAQREKYFELFDLAPVGYLTISDKGIVDDVNFTAAQLLGVERQLLVGQPFSAFVAAPDRDVYYLHQRKLQQTEQRQSCELRLLRVGGEVGGAAEARAGAAADPAAGAAEDAGHFWAHLEGRPWRVADGAPMSCWVTFSDVTEQRRAEEALRESEEHLRSLFQNMLNGYAHCRMVLDDQDRPVDFVYLDVNSAFERLTGLQDVVGKPVSAVLPGIRELSPELFEIYGRVASTGRPEVIEFDFKPLGKWLHISVYSTKKGHFTVVFEDITERKLTEEALAQHAAQLRTALHDTITAMGAIVALRDPYTGRHEERVTCLAEAIAVELGLDESRREGLSIAGRVHDIGKIGVPAEILSKPAVLSATEFTLIQQHAILGRDILSAIAFEWPVADMVHQHHERLDGSGYPRGLKGEQIMLEARILGVADVVEAMASHRPYRPALGIEAALDEVRGGAGTRYDADVVAACERVVAAGAVDLSEEGAPARLR